MKQNAFTRITPAAFGYEAARGRPLKTFFLAKPEFEERDFGSSFDPLLNGVAQGLANLFPPIENAHRPEREDESGRSPEVEDDRSDA